MGEATRLAADPATWFAARVPEVFTLFAWRPGMKAKLTDTCRVIAPESDRLIATGPTAESDLRVDPWNGRAPDYAVAVRAFTSLARHERPESVEPARDWKELPGLLSPRIVLEVIDVQPPFLTFDGARLAVSTFGEVELGRILAYADVAVPAL